MNSGEHGRLVMFLEVLGRIQLKRKYIRFYKFNSSPEQENFFLN